MYEKVSYDSQRDSENLAKVRSRPAVHSARRSTITAVSKVEHGTWRSPVTIASEPHSKMCLSGVSSMGRIKAGRIRRDLFS